MLPHIFDDAPERTRGKIVGLYAILVSANIAVWLWALVAFQGNAAMWSASKACRSPKL